MPRINYHHSEETKRKISQSEKGKVVSAETRKKISISGRGRKLSKETRQKMGDAKRGEKAYQWKKDRTQVIGRHNRSFHDPGYKQWRRKVFDRDNWRCRINNKDCSGRIEAHHILSWSEYVELRYEVNNGIALCHAHHPKKRAEEKRLIPTFQELVSVSKL